MALNDLDKSFGLKATELLHAGTAEAVPRSCSVCLHPNLLLSLQTGYCISHDTVAVCTHTVMRACSASKNALFILSVTALSIDLNKASYSGHFFCCLIPSPPRPTLGSCTEVPNPVLCQYTSLHPPLCQMPAILAMHISNRRNQRAPYSCLVFPPGWWDHLALNGLVCLLTPV